MAQSFYFVDGICADKASKRQMRSHVMKGKNAGKILNRRSKLRQQDSKRTSHREVCDVRGERRIIKGCPLVPDLPSSGLLGNTSVVYWLPVEVTPRSLQIIHEFFTYTSDKIYSPKLGLSIDEAKALWLPTMLSDEASYWCSIDMMMTCNQLILYGDSDVDALCSLSKTFAHVKKRLESSTALSDASVFMLLTLIMQEQIRQQNTAVEVHANGLRKMVELRGGLSKLEGDIGLVIKICKTDVILALQNGETTTYFRDGIITAEKNLAANGLYLRRDKVSPPSCCNGLDRNLNQILVDVMALCDLFNTQIQPRSLDLITYQELLLSMFYRLLRFRSMNEVRKVFDSQSVIHLGLVLSLMTIMLHHGTRTILDFGLVTRCFRDVVGKYTEAQIDHVNLWLMIVGGIWTSHQAQDDRFEARMKMTSAKLRLSNWQDARAAIQMLPWINVLHDQPAEKFWNRIHSISR